MAGAGVTYGHTIVDGVKKPGDLGLVRVVLEFAQKLSSSKGCVSSLELTQGRRACECRTYRGVRHHSRGSSTSGRRCRPLRGCIVLN